MRLFTLLTSAALSCVVVAAPVEARQDTVSMMADIAPWVITNMVRATNANDTSTAWTFGVWNGTGSIDCKLDVAGFPHGSVEGPPSSQANGKAVGCGVGPSHTILLKQ